jgi:hypothetical protein
MKTESKYQIFTVLYHFVSMPMVCRFACQLNNSIAHPNLMKTDIAVESSNFWTSIWVKTVKIAYYYH